MPPLGRGESRLTRNPDDAELRALSLDEPEARETRYGSVAANSEPMVLAPAKTRNNVDTAFGDAELRLLEQARQRLSHESLVSVDVLVGDGSEGVTARLIVPRRYAHVAYGGRKLFLPTTTEDPTYQMVMFFDDEYEKNRGQEMGQKDITVRLAFSPEGKLVKLVRNSNYLGEWKKTCFAGEDYRVKQKGDGIFLHASCRKTRWRRPTDRTRPLSRCLPP